MQRDREGLELIPSPLRKVPTRILHDLKALIVPQDVGEKLEAGLPRQIGALVPALPRLGR